MAPAGDEAMAGLLKMYRPKLEGFAWGTRLVHKSGSQRVRTVAFPSPLRTALKCNNTVHCEYFLAADDGAPAAVAVRRPAVIVLHILDGRFLVARAISSRLAAAGVHALLVKLPYYGPRRPADKAKLEKSMRDDPQILFEGIRQGIMDVRRAARWLGARPEVDPGRIGICGVSLGGFVAAAAAGVDGHFPRVAVLLAGGDLVAVLDNPSREVRELRKAIREKGWDTARLQKLLHPIDPLTYAPRLRRSHVLMINARKDGVIPAACAQKLADAAGAEIHWYPVDHEGMVIYLPAVLIRVMAHFKAKDWRLRRPAPTATGGAEQAKRAPTKRATAGSR
jgi:dienelactone hydrolase